MTYDENERTLLINKRRSAEVMHDVLGESKSSLNNSDSVVLTPANDKIQSGLAIWNLFNDILSPGSVSLPFYVMQAGLWTGGLLMLGFSIITGFTLCLLHKLALKHDKATYPELAEHVFGKVGYGIICFCIFCFNFGGLCAQLIMFGECVPRVLEYIFGPHLLFHREYALLFGCIIFLPISFFRDIAKYTFTSFISVSSIFIISLIVAWRLVFKEAGNYVLAEPGDHHFAQPTALSALGGIAYIFVCHDLSFNVFNSLENPTIPRYRRIVVVTMVTCVFFAILLGTCGFLLFYGTLEANILDNFSNNNPSAVAARIILVIDICITIPFTIFMPRMSIMAVASAVTKRPLNDNAPLFYTVTFLVIGGALAIAETVTDLGAVFELIGGSSACLMAFIMPPLIEMKSERNYTNIPCLVVLILGIFILVSSSVQVIAGLF